MQYKPQKRRYSSTAVGFPIRNDLRAYSQGISEGFPSGERARRAPIYVQAHAISANSVSELLSRALLSPYLRAVFATHTPSDVLKKASFGACLLLGLSCRKPHKQAGTYPRPPWLNFAFCSEIC